MAISLRLVGRGYEKIMSAQSGEEGIAKVSEKNPAVALVDIDLPDMDGYQVCRNIKAQCENDIKVILMARNINHVDIRRVKSAQADDIALKTKDCLLIMDSFQRVMSNSPKGNFHRLKERLQTGNQNPSSKSSNRLSKNNSVKVVSAKGKGNGDGNGSHL
ncbi:MAG: response regulator [Candidatus Omnitrophica bacterium]|nr:response regulator [Candidatus Omnitrophota bacterium]